MESSECQATHHGKLGREILLVLLFKAAALSLIWVLFFSTPPLPNSDPQATAVQLLGPGPSRIHDTQGVSHD
jgi:hypothetical protein